MQNQHKLHRGLAVCLSPQILQQRIWQRSNRSGIGKHWHGCQSMSHKGILLGTFTSGQTAGKGPALRYHNKGRAPHSFPTVYPGTMLSNESLHPPVFSRSNSQASMDSTSMEDFWCEVESIKESSENGQEEQTLLEVKPADEGELEAEWLQEVGLSTLISGAEEEDGQALLSTLTRTQAAAVQKRYNTYTQTMRKKNKHTVRDVRDIFGVSDSSVSTSALTVKKLNSLLTDRVKGRENGLFGVPLTILLENDQKKVPGIKVPLIFQKLLLKLEETGLETEGILRVPGSASRVKNLHQELETKFYEDLFDWDQVRNNDAAGLLKMFIRELPSPLFTVEYLPAFIMLVERISKIKLQLQALHLLILLLPDASRDTAKAFLQFLKKVVANEGKNKMNLWNVSMIVAPNLFICKGKRANQEEMQAAATTAHIVRLLIRYQDILWTVPSFLISQVRKMNEAAMNNSKRQLMFDKGVRKLLRRKTIERERPERSEVHSDVSCLNGVLTLLPVPSSLKCL
uniref:Rho GTPase activating protein 28 n=1 Tax=Crocodylus porosus TaxID=8502 RepID=A0A7M4ETR0_CROPO